MQSGPVRTFALQHHFGRTVTLRTTLLAMALFCALRVQATPDTSLRTPPPLRLPVPSAADSARNRAQLRDVLDRCFTDKGYVAGGVSAKVVSLRTGATLYARGATTPLTPASTTKLFTTVAAFELMGRDASVTTTVRTDGVLDKAGTLQGNVYLVGHGDAILNASDLEDLADDLSRRGIKRITGSVYGDGSMFADSPERPVYSGDYEVVQAMPPVLPLTVNQSTLAVIVSGLPGGRLNVQIVPSGDAFQVVPSPTRRRSRVSVRSATLSNGIQQIVVTGYPGVNVTRTVYASMTRPATAAAGVFAARLRAGGITIDGTIAERPAPPSSRLLAVFRRPLASFAYNINKRSDNHLAEHLFKMVGSACGEPRQPAQRAKRAMLEVLDSLRVPRAGSVFNDGSGLSRRNATTAATEVAMLVAAYKRPWFPAFRSTLAIAGVDGTVRRRMVGTRAQGNVYAKTGSLRNVSALAGYVTTADGEELAFSFISNGPGGSRYKVSENIACIALANFSYGGQGGGYAPAVVDTTIDDQEPDADVGGNVRALPVAPAPRPVSPQPRTPVAKPSVAAPTTNVRPGTMRKRTSPRRVRKAAVRRNTRRGKHSTVRSTGRKRVQQAKPRQRRRR